MVLGQMVALPRGESPLAGQTLKRQLWWERERGACIYAEGPLAVVVCCTTRLVMEMHTGVRKYPEDLLSAVSGSTLTPAGQRVRVRTPIDDT